MILVRYSSYMGLLLSQFFDRSLEIITIDFYIQEKLTTSSSIVADAFGWLHCINENMVIVEIQWFVLRDIHWLTDDSLGQVVMMIPSRQNLICTLDLPRHNWASCSLTLVVRLPYTYHRLYFGIKIGSLLWIPRHAWKRFHTDQSSLQQHDCEKRFYTSTNCLHTRYSFVSLPFVKCSTVNMLSCCFTTVFYGFWFGAVEHWFSWRHA